MAIRATFTADISQFETAVAHAQSSLKDFQLRTDDVGKAMQRMAQQFDGSKIIREANLLTAALGDVKKLTTLTDAELRKVNATLQEAVTKYERIGKTAPASMREMADAVKAQVTHLDQATKQTGAWGTALTQIKTVAAGFIAGFTVDRVVRGLTQAVSATLEYGDAISDLADKTGFSTTALQRWDFAAKQTGTTLDTMVNAAQEVSKRLGDGESSVVGAVTALGLRFDDLRQQTPERQFEIIAKALQGVNDQSQQAAIGADIFGKSWKEVIGPVRAGLQELGDEAERLGAVIDEQTVRAMGELSDSWQALKDSGTGLIATVLKPMIPVLNDIAEAARNAARAIREDFWGAAWRLSALGSGGPFGVGAMFNALFTAPGTGAAPGAAPLSPMSSHETWVPAYERPGFTGGPVVNAEEWYLKAITGATKAEEEAARELAASARYWRDWNAQLRNQTNWAVKDIPITYGWAEWARSSMTLAPTMNISNLGTNPLPWGGVGMLPGMLPDARSSWVPQGVSPCAGWANNALGMAAPWISGAVSNGSRAAGIGGSIGSLGASALSNMWGLAGGALTGLGTAMSVALPVVGPLLGSVLGPLIGKLFGPSEGRVTSQNRSQWIAGLGGNEAFNDLFRQAKITPEQAAALTRQLMSATSAKELEAAQKAIGAAIERNTKLLQEQQTVEAQIASIEEQRKALAESLVPTWDQVSAIIGRYSLNLDQLGTQVNQLGATATWTQMVNDIQALERAGVDVGGMLVGLQEEISALVERSMAFGTEIPAQMRPYIENLRDAGLLVDSQGQAITDLSTLKWGEPVKTQAELVKDAMAKLDESMLALTDRLKEIVDLLANRIPAAAGTPIPTITIPYEYEQVGESPEGVSVPAMASGGIVTRPTLALIGEAGPEAVVPLNRLRGADARPQVIQLTVSSRVLAEVMLDELGRQRRLTRR